jgi:hypothetical protein
MMLLLRARAEPPPAGEPGRDHCGWALPVPRCQGGDGLDHDQNRTSSISTYKLKIWSAIKPLRLYHKRRLLRPLDGVTRREREGAWGGFAGSPAQSGSQPSESYAAVRIADGWYWVDSTDFESKAAFSILELLKSVAESRRDQIAPVLTIPTG